MTFLNWKHSRLASMAGLLALLVTGGWATASLAQTAQQEATRLVQFWAQDRFVWDDHDAPYDITWFNYDVLAKAKHDECFNGIGVAATPAPCAAPSIPKANQAYVWGLVKAGNNIFFGTIANTLCLVEEGYLGMNSPQQTDYWVCDPTQPPYGDFRAPDLWRYNLNLGKLISLNPPAGSAADILRRSVTGFRSAGQANGVTFLAGPRISGGVAMFAFDSATGALLGAQNFADYNDVRSWANNAGQLYVGMGQKVVSGGPGGVVLRWTGSKLAGLFNFEVVAELPTAAANLAVHKNRLYVGTWPGSGRVAGVFQSPEFPTTGLTSANKGQWKQVWSVLNYEPDPIVAQTYGLGAMASFYGGLFWGTMHVPFVATQAAEDASGHVPNFTLDTNGNGTLDSEELVATALGTHRSIAIFQGRALETTAPTFQLLYGETFLPRYDEALKSYTIRNDAFHKNKMNQVPRWGASGLGHFFNAYEWSMQVFEASLYFGTFDWSQVARVAIESMLPPDFPEAARDLYRNLAGDLLEQEGGDLYRFDSNNDPAIAESLSGVGNQTNYGIRTIIKGDYSLFLGTANPMNLHPDGGWELLRLNH